MIVALQLCTPYIKYSWPAEVNKLLGAPTAKGPGSSSPARTMSLKAVYTAVYGEAAAQTVDSKATTIVVDFKYLSQLLAKRAFTSSTWRGRPFTTLTELQVVRMHAHTSYSAGSFHGHLHVEVWHCACLIARRILHILAGALRRNSCRAVSICCWTAWAWEVARLCGCLRLHVCCSGLLIQVDKFLYC